MIYSAENLKTMIMADKYNSIIFKEGKGRDLYLVGGYIRDILRGIRSRDRDYIVSGSLIAFVNKMRRIMDGSVVKFKEGNMVRIALERGLTFDFSKLEAVIEEDLSKRDFTINAMAWSADKGIIDLYNGCDDLTKKRIRCISRENLISDPLRMLRAYRFAAELNGSIEKGTRNLIKILNNNIEKIASERITLELFNLLNSDCSAKYLKSALSDGLLTSFLFIPHKILENNIKAISLLEKARIKELPSRIKVKLNEVFSQNLTYKGLLCLELLMNPDVYMNDRLPNIRLSNNIRKRLELSHRGVKQLRKLGVGSTDSLFGTFMAAKDGAIDALIISGRVDLLGAYTKFAKIWRKGHLSSEDIMDITDVRSGPGLGKMIIELKKAEFGGRVKSRSSALKFIRNLNIQE